MKATYVINFPYPVLHDTIYLRFSKNMCDEKVDISTMIRHNLILCNNNNIFSF